MYCPLFLCEPAVIKWAAGEFFPSCPRRRLCRNVIARKWNDRSNLIRHWKDIDCHAPCGRSQWPNNITTQSRRRASSFFRKTFLDSRLRGNDKLWIKNSPTPELNNQKILIYFHAKSRYYNDTCINGPPKRQWYFSWRMPGIHLYRFRSCIFTLVFLDIAREYEY